SLGGGKQVNPPIWLPSQASPFIQPSFVTGLHMNMPVAHAPFEGAVVGALQSMPPTLPPVAPAPPLPAAPPMAPVAPEPAFPPPPAVAPLPPAPPVPLPALPPVAPVAPVPPLPPV